MSLVGSEQHIETDWPKWWNWAYNPALPSATFGPTSNVIYLAPFDVSGIYKFNPLNCRFKFTYAGLGTGWAFTFKMGIYRMMRGIGGTAATYVLMPNFIASFGAQYPVASPATVYTCNAASIAGPWTIPDGVYAVAFKWQDTSTLTIPPSIVTWQCYGATLPSFAGWWYFGDGSAAGALPATIATVGAASTFRPYFELN